MALPRRVWALVASVAVFALLGYAAFGTAPESRAGEGGSGDGGGSGADAALGAVGSSADAVPTDLIALFSRKTRAPARSAAAPEPATAGDAAAVPGLAGAYADAETAVAATVAACNADARNNADRHVGCIALRGAVFHDNELYAPLPANAAARAALGGFVKPVKMTALSGDAKEARVVAIGQYPPAAKSRHHLRPMAVRFFEGDPATLGRVLYPLAPVAIAEAATPIGYYQSPVIGAQYVNVWHTLADYGVMFFHTLAPLLAWDGGKHVSWLTRPASLQLGKGCSNERECRGFALFDVFWRLVGGRGYVTTSIAGALRFEHLIVGLNTRCSPVPTEDVGTPECKANLRRFRDRVLALYGFDPARALTPAERRCPSVHVMSRQGDRYRRITPFSAMVSALEDHYERRGCPRAAIHVVTLHGGISFREQVASVYNASILVAGRGGGTTLSIFLPVGGGYLSISGFDRWNPFRDLVPPWLHLVHHRVELVHHEHPNLGAMRFKGSNGAMYVDPNRAGYKVDPATVRDAFVSLLREMDGGGAAQ